MSTTKAKLSLAIRVARELAASGKLARDPDGAIYCQINGIAHPLGSERPKRLIARELLKVQAAPRKALVDSVVDCLAADVTARCTTHVRIAEHDGAIWLDCGERFARVDADGWTVHEAAPVWFRRPNGWRPLPTPTSGGSLDDLRTLLGLESDAWALTVAWMVGALRPGFPFPILGLVGEQGTGKSTRAKIVRALVDPNECMLDVAPRCADDALVGAVNAHVLAIDNVSTLPPWLADTLCQVATGGGIRKRRLYANDDVVIVSVLRPVIIAGIGETDRGDLASRTLRIELSPITTRATERDMFARLAEIGPGVLGALLDAVACALRRLPEITIDDSASRMADFAAWATAAEPALGLADGAITEAMQRRAEAGAEQRAEGSVWQLLISKLTGNDARPWHAQPAATLQRMRSILADDFDHRIAPARWELPRSPHALSTALRREAPDLRALGYVIDFDRNIGRGSDKARGWYFSTGAIEERLATEAGAA